MTTGSRAEGAAQPTARGPGQWLRRLLSFVWAFLPALTLGLLAPVPIVHAAVKLRTWTLWAASAVYVAGVIVALSNLGPDVPAPAAEASEAPEWVGVLLIALMVVPTIHALALRRRVFEPRPEHPAIAAVLQARQRREEARAIAARDASLASELRIGRPDLPRQFDDGGLVDVNHVPASVIVGSLGLSEADAAQVTEARDRIGGFSSAEELIVFTELPPALVDDLRERLLFLR